MLCRCSVDTVYLSLAKLYSIVFYTKGPKRHIFTCITSTQVHTTIVDKLLIQWPPSDRRPVFKLMTGSKN